MKYTKEILDDYIKKLMAERFSTEVAIVNNEKNLEKVERERRGLTKRLKKTSANLEDLEKQRKEGFRDKELREQNKNLIAVLRDDKEKKEKRLAEAEGKKSQISKNLELYKDYIETVDSSIEIAKEKVSD